MEFRTERDSLGEVKVPKNALFGAQTQRSVENFKIGAGIEVMPKEIVHALAMIKKACARANAVLLPQKMTGEKLSAIEKAADEIVSGDLDKEFPLVVFQTGSGTQTNMNVNEVIANRGNEIIGSKILHPNDDVNMSQSSNDVFPSAIHLSTVLKTKTELIPAIERLIKAFKEKADEYPSLIKSGRTHFMDATPVKFSQELLSYAFALLEDVKQIEFALGRIKKIALGGTAVGTGLNAPKGFESLAVEQLNIITGEEFISSENKFSALWRRGDIAFFHGAIKSLATDLFKIASDLRFLASGPRTGIGEITLPSNEPGSSIMPGKVNPTQVEALTMVCAKVMGNDVTVGIAASQGNLELNVYAPVIADSVLQSVRLLSDAITSFTENCVKGIKANEEKMKENLNSSLMLVTALSPVIGYEKSAKVALLAKNENITLKEACKKLGYLSEEEFDLAVDPEKMV